MPAGRPSKYDKALAAQICDRLADGQSLREICRAEGMPAESTVRFWAIEDREGFSAQYTRAREVQMDRFAEEILEIADDATNDWMKRQVGDEEIEVANHEHIQRSRLRVDARKWLMSKIIPKKYGDKVTHAGDPDNPIAMTPVLNVFTSAADDQPSPAPKAVNGAKLNGH